MPTAMPASDADPIRAVKAPPETAGLCRSKASNGKFQTPRARASRHSRRSWRSWRGKTSSNYAETHNAHVPTP